MVRESFDEDVTDESHPGLFLFLNHSDCDGEFSPQELEDIIKDLTSSIWTLRARDYPLNSYENMLLRQLCYFVTACKRAHSRNEPLVFS